MKVLCATGSVHTCSNRFPPTTEASHYITAEATTIKSWFSTCHFQLLSLLYSLTAVAFEKMKREYNLHCNLFRQFSAMISTFMVEKWLEVEVVRKLVIWLQNYEENQFWQYKIYSTNTLMHSVTRRNWFNPHTAFIFPFFNNTYFFPLFNKWVLKLIITGAFFFLIYWHSQDCVITR